MKADNTPALEGAAGASPATAPSSWRAHAPWWLALLLALLPAYGPLLVGDEGAIGRDYGMLFLDALTQQRAALLDGHLLLWDGSQVGGTTFWPLPNQAPLYPPLMACVAALGAIRGLNLCLFLHVLFGALGIYALVFRLVRRRDAAFLGGVLFAYAFFTRHLVDILPLEALACTWIPWATYCLCRAQDCTRWMRWSALAGLAYAAVPWLGGFIQFLPGLVVLGTLLLCAVLRRPSKARWGRATASLLVFGVIMTAVSAGKVLPMWHWIALTDRAGGIDAQFAFGGYLRPAEVLEWLRNEGWTPLLLAVCGLVLGLRRRESWIVPFSVAIVVLLLIASGPLYLVLYKFVPGFNYVREPRRVWLLMPTVLPVAAALGASYLQDALRLTKRTAAVAGLVMLALLAADFVVWSRYTLPDRQSLSERLGANAIHQELARRAQDETRFRVVAMEKVRARVKQTADLMRSSFGLEGMEGILGNVAIQRYDNDYLNIVHDAPAKLLGVMNCRYVLSTAPIKEPGFTFVDVFEQDPMRPFPGIDGPYLFRDDLALPRASLAEHALLQVGGTPAQQETLLRTMWDPHRTVLIRVEPAELAALPAADLRRFDGALLFDAGDGLQARLEAEGVSCLDAQAHDLQKDPQPLVAWLAGVLAASKTPVRELADPPREWNGQHLHLPAEAGGRWLVLAETFALYPGWTARVDGQSVPLLVANAVTSAIPLPPGAREVELTYVPPGLAIGMVSTFAGLLLAAFAIRRPAAVPAKQP